MNDLSSATPIPGAISAMATLFTLILSAHTALGWSNQPGARPISHTWLEEHVEVSTRRQLIGSLSIPFLISPSQAQAAVTRAVGSGEIACKEAGNCWQTGEWDGAVGWQWGGKDRCDALDPSCGPDGKLRQLVGRPIPDLPEAMSIHRVAVIQIEIGREEVGVLKLGFYDGGQKDINDAVDQLMSLLSGEGLYTSVPSSQMEIGRRGEGVSLLRGGSVTGIVPLKEIELGIPSQTNAFARSRGRAKAGDDFVPQERPAALVSETFLRPHDQAGLVSVPEKGIGYGGTGFESSDECFESSFLITADALPTFDTKGNRRRVIGQVLDAQSMAFLERLANLPTKRGIRGVLPGQTSGPPLPKVAVRQVQVSNVRST